MRIYYKVNIVYDESDIFIQMNIVELINELKKRFIDYSINNGDKNSLDVKIFVINDQICFKVNDTYYHNLDVFLKENFIVPRISDSNIDYLEFANTLSNMILRKENDKSIIKEKYNKIIRNRFNVPNGLSDIYEENTGSVFFKDYEIELIQNNKLKDLFLRKDQNGSFVYALPTDSGIMMRGVETYYYFIAKTSRFENYSYKDINNWYKNYSLFILESIDIIKNYKVNNLYDLRLLLALVDNIRNYLLLLLNSELVMNGKYNSNIYYVDEAKKDSIGNYIGLINLYQKIINSICLDNNLDSDLLPNINKLLKETLIASSGTIKKLNNEPIELLKKSLCKNREMDYYFENLIGCDYAINNIKSEGEINLITLLYGGLELPFIIKNSGLMNKVNIGLAYQNKGDYLTRQKVDKNEFLDLSIKEFGSVDRKKETIIVDDNIMSGVTMQLLYNELVYHGYNVKYLIGLRHPDLNRIPQIKHFNQAVNLDLVDRLIHGFLFETPYTKIIENTNYNNMFTNKLNFYSIPSKVFLEAMYLNGNYSKNSEVDIFKGEENEEFKNGKTYIKKA